MQCHYRNLVPFEAVEQRGGTLMEQVGQILDPIEEI